MTGRPKAKIDWDIVDEYLRAHCEGTGIASVLGIAADTLYLACKKKYNMTFSAYSAIKKSEGVELIRKKQYELAIKGNSSMLVWLGKQYLGQKEKREVELPQLSELPDIIINARNSDNK